MATNDILYAARDFIREGEEAEYSDTVIALMAQLEPEGLLEETFAAEIMGATWRLRRCRLVEQSFSGIDDLDFDPMPDERTEKHQRNVARARAQSHLILRRSLAELKKLQQNRASEPAIKPNDQNAAHDDMGNDMSMDDFEAMLGLSDAQLNQLDRLAEQSEPKAPPQPAKTTSGNAPCPCKSGAKYKCCCGRSESSPITREAA